MVEIKKVIQRIYNLDLLNKNLTDNSEIVIKDGISEFVNALMKKDIDTGVTVIPSGYQKGFAFKTSNDGELKNPETWIPDTVKFALQFFGLKKGHAYRLIIKGRSCGSNNIITDDRRCVVSTSANELLIEADFKGITENVEKYTYFVASSTEMSLLFTVGKIYLSDIIVDEVELTEDNIEEEELDEVIESGKLKLVSYGVFNTCPISLDGYQGRYQQLTKFKGKGINLYYDTKTNEYLLERDNSIDVIGDSFVNIDYVVDFNFNKVVNKNLFSQYNITEVKNDISPNTLKQGYIKFEFVDDSGKIVSYKNTDSRISIFIYKLY